MQLRKMTPEDLALLDEIDGTVESNQYLHVERDGGGFAKSFGISLRPLREKVIDPFRMDLHTQFMAKQVATGADEGIALVADGGQGPIAMILAQADESVGIMKILDLRVDYDQRRQGLGTAMLYSVIQAARDADLRAVMAESLCSNHPAAAMLDKIGFELSGIDTCRRSNHDLVKEQVTLMWYAQLK